MRRIPRWLRVCLAALLLLVVAGGYLDVRARRVEARVAAFCASVQRSQPVDGLARRAREQGLEVGETDADYLHSIQWPAQIRAEAGFLHERYRCTIHHEHGRVVRTVMADVGGLLAL